MAPDLTMERVFGDVGYGYWVTVLKGHEDWLLLYLMKEIFGEETVRFAFAMWLKGKCNPHEFFSYGPTK